MKKQLLIKAIALSILFCSANLLTNAQAPGITWQKCIGGSGDDWLDAENGLIKLSDGNYLTWGSTNSSDGDFRHNKGGYDAYLLKFDGNGHIIWKKTYGGSGDDIFYDAFENSNGSIVAIGKTASNDRDVSGNHGGEDVWLVKANANGNLFQQHCFGGTGDDGQFSGLLKLNNGNIVFSARTNSNDGDVSGNHGAYDGWIVKLNGQWHIEWQRCVGGSSYDDCAGTIAKINNQIFVAGTSNSYDGDVTNFHGAGQGGDGNGDAYVIKLTMNGNLISAKCYGGSADESEHSFTTTPDDNIVLSVVSNSVDGDVAGGANPLLTMWIVKINTITDNIMWQWCSPDNGLSGGFGIFNTQDGGLVAVGAISTIFDWETWDQYAVKLDGSGNTIWTKRFGGNNFELLCDGLEMPDGGLLIVGFTSSVDGDVSGNHGGDDDTWLVKLGGTNCDYNHREVIPETNIADVSLASYPNPLSPETSGSTTISFSLSQSQNVSLNIFDINGRVVATLADRIFEEGEHQIEFNAEKINAGIYFLKMSAGTPSEQAGEFLKTKKLIVTK